MLLCMKRDVLIQFSKDYFKLISYMIQNKIIIVMYESMLKNKLT